LISYPAKRLAVYPPAPAQCGVRVATTETAKSTEFYQSASRLRKLGGGLTFSVQSTGAGLPPTPDSSTFAMVIVLEI
jgi:hypothetical protein